jgi:hypothetical protein
MTVGKMPKTSTSVDGQIIQVFRGSCLVAVKLYLDGQSLLLTWSQ